MTPAERRAKQRELKQLEKKAAEIRADLMRNDEGNLIYRDAFGATWELCCCTPDESGERMPADHWGITLLHDGLVYVNSQKPVDEREATAFHEIFHSSMEVMLPFDDDINEKITRAAEKTLFPVLKQFGLTFQGMLKR